jgi:putative tricarboxylic transport membrane protein
VTTDRIAGAALTVIGVLVLLESLVTARRLPLGTLRHPGPAYGPVLLALLLVGFGLVLVAAGARAPRVSGIGWTEWRHAVVIFAVCGFAAVSLERLGFRVTMAVVLIVLLGVVERRGIVFTLAYAVGFAMAAFLVFDTVLRVPLPRGPLGL